MQEDLISFETAKLAKEKGFDCNTKNYFTPQSGKLVYRIHSVIADIRIKQQLRKLENGNN